MNNKILVVDDDEIIIELYKRWLNSWGYCVNVAHGGKEALNYIDNEKFDLVICDAKMPEISGLDVRQKLAQKHPQTPFILITGFSCNDHEIRDILELNVQKHIEKPVDFIALRDVIDDLMTI